MITVKTSPLPATLLLLAASAFAAEPRDWKTATLIETHRSRTYAGDIGNVYTPSTKAVYRNVQNYTLDLGPSVLTCSEVLVDLLRKAKPLPFPVGSPVRYARLSSGQIVVQDEKGKEHKLMIEQEKLKSVPAP